MRKIFIVEDDNGIRDVLEILLTEEKYLVQSFESITDFNNRDCSILADLYLFDVMLPDGSGIDLCKALRKNETKKIIPVLIMSAHASITDLDGIHEPKDFIQKPFDINNLLGKIKVALA